MGGAKNPPRGSRAGAAPAPKAAASKPKPKAEAQPVAQPATQPKNNLNAPPITQAVPVIRQREIDAKKTDGFSNPQIDAGAAFKAHWARWMKSQAH